MATKTWGRQHSNHVRNAEARDGLAEQLAPARLEVSEEQRSQLIHTRAYGLWEEAGHPDGDAARERFWCEAEKQVMASHAADE